MRKINENELRVVDAGDFCFGETEKDLYCYGFFSTQDSPINYSLGLVINTANDKYSRTVIFRIGNFNFLFSYFHKNGSTIKRTLEIFNIDIL